MGGPRILCSVGDGQTSFTVRQDPHGRAGWVYVEIQTADRFSVMTLSLESVERLGLALLDAVRVAPQEPSDRG